MFMAVAVAVAVTVAVAVARRGTAPERIPEVDRVIARGGGKNAGQRVGRRHPWEPGVVVYRLALSRREHGAQLGGSSADPGTGGWQLEHGELVVIVSSEQASAVGRPGHPLREGREGLGLVGRQRASPVEGEAREHGVWDSRRCLRNGRGIVHRGAKGAVRGIFGLN